MPLGPLTLQDCALAAHLHQAVFYKGWTEQDFQDFLRDPHVFGVKISSSFPRRREPRSHKHWVFLGSRLRGNDECMLFNAFILWREVADEAEILTLVVAPLNQRKGVGTCLLNVLLDQLKEKGISKLFLEVAEDNEKAISFYLSHGFHMIGKRPQYYVRPHHTCVDGLSLYKVINQCIENL